MIRSLLLVSGCGHVVTTIRPVGVLDGAVPEAPVEVVLALGAASQYAGNVPDRLLLGTSDPTPAVNRLDEKRAANLSAIADDFEDALGPGWEVGGLPVGPHRLEVGCDWRVELDVGEPRGGGGGAMLLSVLNGFPAALSLTVVPWRMPATPQPETPAPWRVVSCRDESVAAEGTWRYGDPSTVWLFNTWRNSRFGFDGGDPFTWIATNPRPEPAPVDAEAIRAARLAGAVRTSRAYAHRQDVVIRDLIAGRVAYRDLEARFEGPPSEADFAAVDAGWTKAGPYGPAPAITGYASPYTSTGALADWATRLAAGEAVGNLAGDLAVAATSEAIDSAASNIPYIGGLVATAAKKQVETSTSDAVRNAIVGALPADQRLATPCALVHDVARHEGRPDYGTAVTAVFAVYPEVRAQWDACLASRPAAVAAPAGDLAGQLERLEALRASGAISADEFAAAKAKLLGL